VAVRTHDTEVLQTVVGVVAVDVVQGEGKWLPAPLLQATLFAVIGFETRGDEALAQLAVRADQ